jgi:hypothetical protein
MHMRAIRSGGGKTVQLCWHRAAKKCDIEVRSKSSPSGKRKYKGGREEFSKLRERRRPSSPLPCFCEGGVAAT